jgi:hypothetical protein
MQEPQEEFDESSSPSGDEYVQEGRAVTSKPKKRRKVRRPDDEARRQSKKRKRTVHTYNEQELDDMTPEDGQWQMYLFLCIRQLIVFF